jgi:uncharacterized iron-regulated membrane protein
VTRFFVYVRRVHLLCAVCAGAVLAVAGVTGGALVFRRELDRALNPTLLRVEGSGARITVSTALAAARASFPSASVARVELPRAADEPFEIITNDADPLQVFVHPYAGTLLGARRQSESFTYQLFRLHTTLLAGKTGEVIVGFTGLMLVVMSLTGVMVWSSAVRRGRKAIFAAVATTRSGNWKRTNFDLHRAVGIWTALLLAMAGATGAALVFHDAAAGILDRITQSVPRPHAPQVTSSETRPMSPDALLAIARAQVADLQPYYVIFPARPSAPAVVRGRVPGELHPNGRNFIYLNPGTGEVLELEAARRAPAGTRIYDTFYPIHIGRWGGLPVRVIYTVLGLTPLVLGITGFLAWWNRRGRRLLPVSRGERPDSAARGKRAVA